MNDHSSYSSTFMKFSGSIDFYPLSRALEYCSALKQERFPLLLHYDIKGFTSDSGQNGLALIPDLTIELSADRYLSDLSALLSAGSAFS